jgi:hypothetical protein
VVFSALLVLISQIVYQTPQEEAVEGQLPEDFWRSKWSLKWTLLVLLWYTPVSCETSLVYWLKSRWKRIWLVLSAERIFMMMNVKKVQHLALFMLCWPFYTWHDMIRHNKYHSWCLLIGFFYLKISATKPLQCIPCHKLLISFYGSCFAPLL